MTTGFPSPDQFLLAVGLYSEYEVTDENVWDALRVLYFDGTYDCYCVGCKREATFKARGNPRPDSLDYERFLKLSRVARVDVPKLPVGIYALEADCSRSGHSHVFYFLASLSVGKDASNKSFVVRTVQKIGQHPAFADLNMGAVKDYSDVLTKAQRSELVRAIGLASHDVGIGAYVYLRRVFESLIEEAHVLASTEDGWSEEAYERLRMWERIAILKEHLPQFISEHPEMYSILSKGIHELTEQECLDHFGALKLGIEMILDEKQQARKRARKIAEAKAAVSQAHMRLLKG